MKRFLTTVAAAALASAAVAAPASARPEPMFDHDQQELQVSADGCGLGHQASGLYDDLSTDRASLIYDPATTSVTVTCTFKGIPAKVKARHTYDGREWDGDGYEDWLRPAAGTTRSISPCRLFAPEYESYPGYDLDNGGPTTNGTLTFVRGGTAVTTCTFDLDG